MDLTEKLLAHLKGPTYVPQTLKGLAASLEVRRKDERELKRIVNYWVSTGELVRIKADRFCLPSDADLVTGILHVRPSGDARLAPITEGPSIYIRADDSGVALHGDKVIVRKIRPLRVKDQRDSFPTDALFGRVIEILSRARETIVGTLQARRHIYFVIPDDTRIPQDILVGAPEPLGPGLKPKLGDKVVVKLLEWTHRHLNPVGEIIEILGESHTPQAEYLGILHKYNLNPNFPASVIEETRQLPDRVQASALKNRLDIRKLFTVTIDPPDAKDFDDALSLEELPGGAMRVGVHIADVNAYVKQGSALDKEAQTRGNSTYLVGTVIPMLPHVLSNGLCSLVEAEDRLTKTVFLTFDEKSKLINTEFANSVICSSKRLSYPQAFAFLQEDNLKKIRTLPNPPAHQTGATGKPLSELTDAQLSEIQKMLRIFWRIAHKLRNDRMESGSLDLDMPEVKIYVDQEGYADRIERITHDISHQLIEEFMLAANEAIAKAIFTAQMPLISRVHDKPDDSRLKEYRDYLSTFRIQSADLTVRKSVMKVLEILKTHPQGHHLRIEFLKSLKQACYRARADGHYGLHKAHYTHFTSPIRRYSDLIVHRLFDSLLIKLGLDTAPSKVQAHYTQKALDSICEHISLTERASTEAERESVKIKLLEYFEREAAKLQKTPLEAIIVDVKNIGLFVELTESMAFGLIRISSIKDDLYLLTPDGTALVGRRTRRKFHLGQKIQVCVENVNRFKRQMDFVLAPPSSSSKATSAVQKSISRARSAHTSRKPARKPAGKPRTKRA